MNLTMNLLILILITLLIIKEIVIVLKIEELEKDIILAFKITHKKPLTQEERRYVNKCK